MKRHYKFIIGIIIGLILSGVVGYAKTVLTSKEVSYDNTKSKLSSTNIKDAIDEVNEKATTKLNEAKKECPDNNKCIVPICKKATTLHTSECTNSTTCGSNTSITYGKIVKGSNLSVGDAFDCDVNGDGIYNPENERFYYIGNNYNLNKEIEEDYEAILVYYTYSGYAEYDESGVNNNGPVSARTVLPKSSEWKNVSLINKIRPIISDDLTTRTDAGSLPTKFSYEGYSARLLTSNEIRINCSSCDAKGCSFSHAQYECEFLLENTRYESTDKPIWLWLEEPLSDSSTEAMTLMYNGSMSERRVSTLVNSVVKPVIEVPKYKLLY